MSTDPIDVRGQLAFVQAQEALDLRKVAGVDNEAPFARGQIIVAASIADALTVNYDVLSLEVNVLGVLGGATDVLARFGFSKLLGLARLELDKPFDSIAFEARQVVLGAGSPNLPQSLSYSVVGRFWR